MTNSVFVWAFVEDGHVLRSALEFEDQRKKGRLSKTLRRQVEEGSIEVGLSMEDALCSSKLVFCHSSNSTRLRCIRPLIDIKVLPDLRQWLLAAN